MAIEDGVLLAELLASAEHYSLGFEEFMKRRFERVKNVVVISNQLAAWELLEWHGKPDPDAKPGLINRNATMALLEDY